MPPVASVMYWENGRKVVLVSAQEIFGAAKVNVKDELEAVTYPPQPAAEMVGWNLINSVVTFRAMSGDVKLADMKAMVKGKIGWVRYVAEVTMP